MPQLTKIEEAAADVSEACCQGCTDWKAVVQEVASRLEIAMFGTTEEGEYLDDDDTSVPVGEFRRLMHEAVEGNRLS